MAIIKAKEEEGIIELPELPREISSQRTQDICRSLTELLEKGISWKLKWRALKTGQPVDHVERIYLHADEFGMAYVGDEDGAAVTLEVAMVVSAKNTSDGLLFSVEKPTLTALDTVLRSELGVGEDYPVIREDDPITDVRRLHQHQLASAINRALKGMNDFREALITPS